jgi:hypothetical protein
LATRNEVGRECLRCDEEVPAHRAVWIDFTNESIRGLVPSNIAEGKGRQTMKEFRSFLFHARGSLLELETQVQLAQELKFLSAKEAEDLQKQCSDLGSGLAGLINHLNAKTAAAVS